MDYLQKPIDLELLILALERAKEKIAEEEKLFSFSTKDPGEKIDLGIFSDKQNCKRTQRKD